MPRYCKDDRAMSHI